MRTVNIEIATKIVKEAGIEASFSAYSDAHGISVYFHTADGKKVRVSTHGVTNSYRIANEIHLNLPLKTLPTKTKEVTKFVLTPEMIARAAEIKASMEI